MSDEETLRRVRPYAPILASMVEDMGSTPGMKFGEAYDAACAKCSVRPEDVPEDVHSAIMAVAFKIIGGGRILGLPDA